MIGQRIKMLRVEKNLTMKDMAQMFGLSISAWNKYEKGESEPRLEYIIKMADFFNVTTDFLLCRTNVRGSKVLNNLDSQDNLLSQLESIRIGDISHITYILSNIDNTINLYQKGDILEPEMQTLLNLINNAIVFFNDIITINTKQNNMSNKVLPLYQDCLNTLIGDINQIFNSICKIST